MPTPTTMPSCVNAFKKCQRDFHAKVNTNKNSGLYVDFKDGKFTAPIDAIEESTAVIFQRMNAEFLQRGESIVRLLRGMESEPHLHVGFLICCSKRIEELLATKGSNREGALHAFVEEMITDYASKRAACD